MNSNDPLLQPFQLKHLILRNRIVSTCHEPAFAEAGHPGLRYRLYHEEKARGGVAMTMVGGSANVAPDSPSVFGQLYLGDDSVVPHLQRLAEGIHRHGAHTICQITHMGRRTKWNSGHWLPAGRPQPRPSTEGGYQLFRIGDAVASRNIHAAIYDALRLSLHL